ncbi:uncharacterized protein LOC141655500 [Silene latifolia]|uniref:uncharacterized protein LOC141655500 n=1 Tax=Silene latifolia TaxID=37657 RepID=UPI003D773865
MLEGWSVTTNCSLHKGGRVWLLWRPTVFDVNIIQYDPQFIHSRILIKATQQVFLLTIVYAFNEGSQRLDLWDNLKIGAFFTWTNKQDNLGHRKYNRLDRFLVNQEWVDVFPDMHAHFHPEGLMDHTPCIVRNVKLDSRRANSFKYFNMWSDAPNFLDTVKSYWSQQIDGTKMFRVVKILKALKGGLKNLNKECFSDVELNASKANHTLEEIQLQLQDNYDNPDLITLELQALDKVRFWTKARDSFLQQKAKTQWIDEGDRNTAYFHNVIKKRCLRNKIVQIEDQYVHCGLLGSKKETEHVRMEVLQTGSFCSDQHCISLLSPVTKEEIKSAVFSIPKDKAPRPDGYTSGFFKDSWDIIGDA